LDADSRISSLEYNFQKFQTGMNDIKKQAKKEAQRNAKTLSEIFTLLHTGQQGGKYLANTKQHVPSDTTANHPDQLSFASGSIKDVAGSGS